MAQAETRPTSTIVGGTTKLRIKLKLPVGAKKPCGAHTGGTISTGNQLADLHAAVEAFCQQGLRGLHGAVLLSPWIEPSPIEQLAQQQQHQADGFSLPGLQQPQLPGQELGPPSRRRVRKRREPEPAEDDTAQFDMQQLAWGSIKRRRSVNHRARDAARLSNSIHSMLQTVPAGQGSPASPSVVSQPQADAAAHSRPAPDGGVKPVAQHPFRLHRASAPGAAAAGVVQAATAPVATEPPPAATIALREPASAAQSVDVDMHKPAAVSAPPAAAAVSKAAQPGVGTHQLQQQQQLPQPEVRPNSPQAEAKQGEPKQHRLQQQDVQQQDVQQQRASEADKQHQEQKQQQRPEQQQQQKPEQKQQQKPEQKQVQRQTPQNQQQVEQNAEQAQQEQTLTQQKQKHSQQEQENQQPAAVQPVQLAANDAPDAQLAHTPAENAAIAQAAAAAVPAAVQDQKLDSPASETSHQQGIEATVQQHLQELLPNTVPPQPGAPEQQQQPPELQGEVLQQPKQPEQTAVSRDRSQCSLQRAQEAPRGPAAVSMPAPAAVPVALLAPTAAGGSGRLLELATATLSPAAGALASLSAVPEVRQRVLPPEDLPVRTQEEALRYLSTIMDKAKHLKHSGDKRNSQLGAWDVFGLSFYALSTVEFLMYWDTANRLLSKLRAQEQPVERLQQQIISLSNAQFLRQTGQLSTTAMNICSNCKGPDVAKQALRMLLERLSAISNLRNLHNQRKQLESHIRVLKSNGASLGSGSSSVNGIRTAQPQQQAQYAQQGQQGQQQARVQLQHTAAGKPPSPGGSSWSPAGQQNFNKRSPDDSNTSNQERLQLPVGAEHGSGAPGVSTGGAVAGTGGHAAALQAERALALAKSERALLDSMQELLKMTDGMHQTVMRMQQFLESPDVLASEHARAAALHISVLGLDAGMFSIPRVAAHTEAAVTCLTKLLRSGS